MSKILLRERHLKKGLVFKEENRFYPDKDWAIMRLEKYNPKTDEGELSVLAYKNSRGSTHYDRYHPVTGTKTMYTNPSLHCKHNNTTWISYYLPYGDILYGKE